MKSSFRGLDKLFYKQLSDWLLSRQPFNTHGFVALALQELFSFGSWALLVGSLALLRLTMSIVNLIFCTIDPFGFQSIRFKLSWRLETVNLMRGTPSHSRGFVCSAFPRSFLSEVIARAMGVDH